MRLSPVIFASALGLYSLFGARPALAGSADCYRGDDYSCAVEAEVLRLTNQYRSAQGLSPLAPLAHLAFVARGWSVTQAQRAAIGHDGFPNARESAYLAEFGSMEGTSVRGENVAMSYADALQAAKRVAKELTDLWWGSAPHRANMLGAYSGLGVGFARAAGGGVYGTQIFAVAD